ncbi:MAG TPA: sulfite exporter TauE/SafE family protein [Candidatus Eisenbacteria bacterium]|nr:sulfite exporter TauE/SafE family protein [Candidatus Eisenbacteria bacterium]
MPPDFLLYVLAGFLAQLVDGALGMAYGVTASSLLLSYGVPPAATSATVHAAECFTTGVSGLSHHWFRNVNGAMFRKLLLPGIVGAVVGAYLLTTIPGERFRPFIAGYLLVMGLVIILKAFRPFPPNAAATHLGALGFVGALVDAMGGGGWGPVVASTLIVRGHDVKNTVGTVNAVEFFVTVAASVTFFLTIGVSNWPMILGLALGGVPAAPLAAWACKRVRPRPLMVGVGCLVILLSVRTLLRHFGAI